MPIIRSLSTAVAASGLPLERGGSSAVGPSNVPTFQRFSQTQQFITQIFLWQHVSTLLSHHQAFQRTDTMYQNL